MLVWMPALFGAMVCLVVFAWVALRKAREIGRSQKPAHRTLRAGLKKLPVLREPTVQRLLAVSNYVERRCERCEYFNLEAGQKAMSAYGPFAQAAAFLPPAQMARPPRDEDGNFIEQPPDVKALNWADFGACASPAT